MGSWISHLHATIKLTHIGALDNGDETNKRLEDLKEQEDNDDIKTRHIMGRRVFCWLCFFLSPCFYEEENIAIELMNLELARFCDSSLIFAHK